MQNITRYIGEHSIEFPVYGLHNDADAAGKLVTDVLRFIKQSAQQNKRCLASEISSVTVSVDEVSCRVFIPEGTTCDEIIGLNHGISNVVLRSTGFLNDFSKMKQVRFKVHGTAIDDVEVVSFVGTRNCIEKFVVKHGLPAMFDPTENETMFMTTIDGKTIRVNGFVVAHDDKSFEFVGQIV